VAKFFLSFLLTLSSYSDEDEKSEEDRVLALLLYCFTYCPFDELIFRRAACGEVAFHMAIILSYARSLY
jgi:hypothetical protein